MKKSISWYQLYKRIGKQMLHKTRNTKVQVLIDGELKGCKWKFADYEKGISRFLYRIWNIGGSNAYHYKCCASSMIYDKWVNIIYPIEPEFND